jgi:beta-aspartyl-peptidase (threonine type)
VMEKSEHVFLSSQGADEFSELVGCEIVDPSYFIVESRQQQLRFVHWK